VALTIEGDRSGYFVSKAAAKKALALADAPVL
jgi:hypothetical protein